MAPTNDYNQDLVIDFVESFVANHASQLNKDDLELLKARCWETLHKSMRTFSPDRGNVLSWIHTNLRWTVKAFLNKKEAARRHPNLLFDEAIKPPKAIDDA